jgi:hypothetical protein
MSLRHWILLLTLYSAILKIQNLLDDDDGRSIFAIVADSEITYQSHKYR